MTQEEIFDYNKRCAEFLRWESAGPGFPVGYWEFNSDKIVFYEHMMFHSDWNWIMEVIKSIQKIIIKNDEEFCIEFYQGLPNKSKTFVSIGELGTESEDPKEAVVQAINQFLIWYNTQKL
jgi:hypothetical protein